MTTAILVPVLRRPRHVARLMDNIADATPEPHRVVFIADWDDFDERLELERCGAHYLTVRDKPPNYPAKMNLALKLTTDPFVFLAADDVVFHRGWLSAALDEMQPNIAVVGTHDGGVNKRVRRGMHATHMLVRRAYVNDCGATFDGIPGAFIHEGYRHSYVDDELVQLAMARRVYAHARHSIVEHRHPFGGTADTDEVYELGQSFSAEDRALYQARRKLLKAGMEWTARSWSPRSATTTG